MANHKWLPQAQNERAACKLSAIGALLSLLTFASVVVAQEQQQDFSKVQVETQKVSGNIYMLTGVGGDIAVCVGENGLLMINSSFAPMSEKIEAALKKLSDKPVRFVVDMHWHVGIPAEMPISKSWVRLSLPMKTFVGLWNRARCAMASSTTLFP